MNFKTRFTVFTQMVKWSKGQKVKKLKVGNKEKILPLPSPVYSGRHPPNAQEKELRQGGMSNCANPDT